MRNYNPLTLHWSRLAVHTRIVLVMSAVLFIGGTLAIFYMEIR